MFYSGAGDDLPYPHGEQIVHQGEARADLNDYLNPIVRTQATALFIFRPKAFLDVQAPLEENSATVGIGVLEAVYKLAVSQPFQILYVNLKATDVNEMLYLGFQQRIRVNEEPS